MSERRKDARKSAKLSYYPQDCSSTQGKGSNITFLPREIQNREQKNRRTRLGI